MGAFSLIVYPRLGISDTNDLRVFDDFCFLETIQNFINRFSIELNQEVSKKSLTKLGECNYRIGPDRMLLPDRT